MSPVLKRSIVIAGHKTSISLEGEFWNSFKEIAGERGMTVAAMIRAIDGGRKHAIYRQQFDFCAWRPSRSNRQSEPLLSTEISKVGDTQYWCRRAEEARTIAGELTDPDAKCTC